MTAVRSWRQKSRNKIRTTKQGLVWLVRNSVHRDVVVMSRDELGFQKSQIESGTFLFLFFTPPPYSGPILFRFFSDGSPYLIHAHSGITEKS